MRAQNLYILFADVEQRNHANFAEEGSTMRQKSEIITSSFF